MIVLHCRKPRFLSLPVSPPIYRSKSAKFQLCSLVPRRSLLPCCPREVWERAGERTPSQYWQNTPDFSGILPLVTFYEFLQLHFGKTARR